MPVPVCGRFSIPSQAARGLIATLHLRVSGLPPVQPQHISLDNPRNENRGTLGPLGTGPEWANVDIGGVFAIDIGPYIHFPPQPARIEYVVEFGGQRSAVMSFDWQPVAKAARRKR